MRTKETVRFVLGLASVPLFIIAFFMTAGRWDWVAGWAYLGLLAAGQGAGALYLWRKDPELIRRRGSFGEGTKSWDKALLSLFGLSYLAVPIVAALDSVRYGWSSMPPWLWFAGLVLYGVFPFFTTWAMAVNTHFEKTVRIQTDRDHKVVDSGPYALVRHPGYVGTILGFLFSPPLLLLSWWAFAPAVVAALALVVRTALEDRLLRRELEGYSEYAERVRFRLVPGVW
ncbi:MAG: methyltransferase family protein [Planctomycetota bacterium]|jgi:protein-S-isoprenylcysteine O-methyltransferase Ste14